MGLHLNANLIAKSCNGESVLDECSFSFSGSGIYVLTGPNGSGKSTFMRICALLEEPDSGKVVYLADDTEVGKGIDLRRRITLVLPKTGLFNATVMDNAEYGLKIRNVEKSERRERASEALKNAGLLHKARQNALTLSSGETQRLGIARALVLLPEALFLDEPTASVDRKNTAVIEDLIFRFREKSDGLIIMSTHDKSQAERLAGTLLAMDDGRLSPL